MLCLFLAVFNVFSIFLIFEFFLRQHFLKFVRRYSEDETDRSAHSGSADSVMKLENCPFSKSGWATASDDGDGDDGRIFPEHPSPILHAPRDIISST